MLAAAGLVLQPPAALALSNVQGFLTVPAAIAGAAVTLLLDTGADTSLITPEAARLLRLPVGPGRHSRMQGTGGGRLAPQVRVGTILLDRLRISGLSLPVASLPSFPRLSPPVAGLLGGDILTAFTVAIDLAGGTLVLREAGAERPGGVWLAARRDGNRLWLPAELDGLRLRALFDTGARSIILAARASARLGVTAARLAADPGGITSGIDLREAAYHWHRFARLRIGAVELRDPILTVVPLDEAEDLLLGAPFFAAHRVTLCYARARVQIVPN